MLFHMMTDSQKPTGLRRGKRGKKRLSMNEKGRVKRCKVEDPKRERDTQKWHITACKDKTWDWVLTFATGQLMHCCWAFDYLRFLRAFLVNRALALTPTLNSATSRSSTNCDVSSLCHLRYLYRGQMWRVRVHGQTVESLWAGSGQSGSAHGYFGFKTTSMIPLDSACFETRGVEMHELEKPNMRKWFHCCLA